MKTKVLAALLLCSGAVFAQSNAEDVPPPQPLPPGDAAYEQATPKVAPSRSVPGEEQHAWDFGVSFAPQADGLLVRGVIVGSPAAAMGVKPNDLIVSANSDVADSDALMNTTVSSVTVIRGDQRLELNGSRRSQAPDQSSVLRKPYSAPQTTYAPQQAYSAPRQSYTTPRPSLYRATNHLQRSTHLLPSAYGDELPLHRAAVVISVRISLDLALPLFHGPAGLDRTRRGLSGLWLWPGIWTRFWLRTRVLWPSWLRFRFLRSWLWSRARTKRRWYSNRGLRHQLLVRKRAPSNSSRAGMFQPRQKTDEVFFCDLRARKRG